MAYTWRGTRCRFARRRRRSDRRVPRGMPDGDCKLPGTVVRGGGLARRRAQSAISLRLPNRPAQAAR
ncbi:putative lipoprotein [Burkholderia pseudomallei 305]|nr:putative lipoprotein [Burkholderia pseudomallei 305]